MQSQAAARSKTWHEYSEKQIFLTFLVCSFVFLFMQTAYASYTPMGDVLCEIVGIVYGNLGKGLASLAVITVGVGALLGKTSWGLAMTVAVGISVIFGAHRIVAQLLPASANVLDACGYFVL